MTGAIDHYRATLRLEPEYLGAIEQLRIPSCYIKYHQSPSPKQNSGDTSCVRNDERSEMKCGDLHRMEREERSCGSLGAEDQQQRYEQNTLTSIQVRTRKLIRLKEI
jgi:hypothetical protein